MVRPAAMAVSAHIKGETHMGDKSPKNNAKSNKQKADHKSQAKSSAPAAPKK
jgi:hypothetical protein